MKKNNGLVGMNFEQIMIQQAQREVEKPVYCRVCGQDIKKPSKYSAGGEMGDWKRNQDWELEYKVHTSCAQKHMASPRRR